jgi:hypothetical protein
LGGRLGAWLGAWLPDRRDWQEEEEVVERAE